MAKIDGVSKVKIHAVYMAYKTQEEFARMNKYNQFRSAGRGTFNLYSLPIHWFIVDDINNEQKLAKQVRMVWGFGKFQLHIYSVFRKNKNYNQDFTCSTGDCFFFQEGLCKVRSHLRTRIGVNCKRNSMIRPNWKPVIEITIKKRNGDGFIDDWENNIQDYTYEIDYSKSHLNHLWWWNKENIIHDADLEMDKAAQRELEFEDVSWIY